jgi:hypothetical protein
VISLTEITVTTDLERQHPPVTSLLLLLSPRTDCWLGGGDRASSVAASAPRAGSEYTIGQHSSVA